MGDRWVSGRKLTFLALAALVVAGTAAGWLWAARDSKPQVTQTLRLGAFEGDVGGLQWIAKEKGFFDAAGLAVEMVGFSTGKQSVDALRKGLVDVATASEFVVATRGFAEPDLRILSTVSQYWNKGLIGRRDHGVNRPSDLVGKRIGVTATSTAEHTLKVFLATNGIGDESVTLVNLLPKQIVEAISAGTIDAAMTWQPHVGAISKALGSNAVTLLDRGTEAFLVVMTRSDLIAGRTEAISRMLQGLLAAEKWVKDNPAEAKQYLATRFKLSPDYLDVLWPRMVLTARLPQDMVEAMDSEARWFAKANGHAQIPNVAHFVHGSALRSVQPSVVTTIGE